MTDCLWFSNSFLTCHPELFSYLCLTPSFVFPSAPAEYIIWRKGSSINAKTKNCFNWSHCLLGKDRFVLISSTLAWVSHLMLGCCFAWKLSLSLRSSWSSSLWHIVVWPWVISSFASPWSWRNSHWRWRRANTLHNKNRQGFICHWVIRSVHSTEIISTGTALFLSVYFSFRREWRRASISSILWCFNHFHYLASAWNNMFITRWCSVQNIAKL